jgi:hypothetical protein
VYKLLINGEELTWGSDDLYDYLAQYGEVTEGPFWMVETETTAIMVSNSGFNLLAFYPIHPNVRWEFWVFQGHYRFLANFNDNFSGAVRGFLNNVDHHNAQIAKKVSRRS